MTISETQQAIELDKILEAAIKTNSRVVETIIAPEVAQDLGEILEQANCGRYLGAGTFMVYPSGLEVAKQGGFHKKLIDANREAERIREKDRLQEELIRRQIRALKREPYLISISIVSTVIAILSFLFK
ncbi:hypothetical protein [Porphyromonas macacae]|uniref:Uncharacterized protein n=1 Tax=Porphyromonas macacae TaxID=28115 RepID=A0A379DGT1_9PORP|nr:hypothetical protein [Porphyromonas macacae]SUB77352.1 Uncharacterised protein [Porphyromonas macacae]